MNNEKNEERNPRSPNGDLPAAMPPLSAAHGKSGGTATSAASAEPDDEPIDAIPLYRNFKLVIPLFLVIVGGAVWGWNWYLGMLNFVTTDDAYIDGNRISISTKMLGRVDTLLADEGDTVHAGEILVKLDRTDLLAQETQTRAALALAQSSVVLAQTTVAKAQNDFSRAEAQFKDAIIPKEQYDNAQSALQAAQAQYGIALARVTEAEAQAGVVKTQLENTIVVSPLDGIVSKRWVLPGDVVQAGQPVFTVYDMKNLWVTANLEETDLSALRLQDSVEITVDSYRDKKFTGTVYQIGANTASEFSLIPPNNASGNFTKLTQRVPVKVTIAQIAPAGPPAVLRPGMSVEVKVKVR